MELALLALGAGTVLLGAGSCYYGARSLPIQMSRQWARLQAAHGEVVQVVDDLQAEWRRVKKQLDSELDELDTILQRVERKRRSAAAAASRAQPQEPPANGSASGRAARIAAARSRARERGWTP